MFYIYRVRENTIVETGFDTAEEATQRALDLMEYHHYPPLSIDKMELA